MRTKSHKLALFLFLLTILATSACSAPPRSSDLGGLYNELARNEDPYRNPVILIPGILGSKLVDRPSDVIVWGAFGSGSANPNTAEGARLVALPMTTGKKFSELQNNVIPTETLDKVVISFGGYPLVLNTYAHILGVLGVGGYRDQQQSIQDVVDWGDLHFTCFQFAAEDTDRIVRIAKNGKLSVTKRGPGDGVVLRSSALLDERGPGSQTSRLISPIGWKQVMFLFSDHRNITNDPTFTDNLLYILLERPRE